MINYCFCFCLCRVDSVISRINSIKKKLESIHFVQWKKLESMHFVQRNNNVYLHVAEFTRMWVPQHKNVHYFWQNSFHIHLMNIWLSICPTNSRPNIYARPKGQQVITLAGSMQICRGQSPIQFCGAACSIRYLEPVTYVRLSDLPSYCRASPVIWVR